MKKCFKCGVLKALSEFYKHAKMADGHLNKCKECTKIDVKERRRVDPSVQAYDRKRGNRQAYSYLIEYRQRYPLKYAAHSAVAKAVKHGILVNPLSCEVCQSSNTVEAHHDNYSKPLEVRWLCALCHKRWHAEHGEALNGD